MNSSSIIALSGLAAAQDGLLVSAHNIANLNTAGFRRQQAVQSANPSGGVRTTVRQAAQPGNALEADVVGQLEAKNAFLANLAVFRAQGRMVGSLLDILG
jgi:flagellar hook-associated protein FlgK